MKRKPEGIWSDSLTRMLEDFRGIIAVGDEEAGIDSVLDLMNAAQYWHERAQITWGQERDDLERNCRSNMIIAAMCLKSISDDLMKEAKSM